MRHKTRFKVFTDAERAEAYYNLVMDKGGSRQEIKFATVNDPEYGTKTYILLLMSVPEEVTVELCEWDGREAVTQDKQGRWLCADHAGTAVSGG